MVASSKLDPEWVQREAERWIERALETGASELRLNRLGLTTLPESIGQLSRLEWLDVSNNRLTVLPVAIGQLTLLRWLDVSDNQLTSLPETIGQLSQLQELHAYSNQLTGLPETIGQLSRLQELLAHSNQLTALPETIGQLSQLWLLQVSNNRLTALPEAIERLTTLKWLFLHGNDALGLPVEVLGPTWPRVEQGSAQPAKPADILEYYFRTRAGRRPLNEAKLVLVGFGGVGKTSLVGRLVNDRFDPHEAKTEGIAITDWPLRLHGEENVRLHVWDFGGQEIMHATHQFFLTQRSLYLLVLTGREGREDADAEYWLNLIASFAAESPVIIVLNKIRQHRFTINRPALQQKFPNLRDVIETDCADPPLGLDGLRDLVQRETNALPDLRASFPSAWFAIKDRLSTMPDNYLSFERYRTLCAENGEADAVAQEHLAGFLHALGIALNYKDDPRLRDTHVLNPRWVTEGVYTILNHDLLAEQRGELRAGDLAAILDPKAYPPERHGFLVELMRKFELCFRFPEEEDHYLVPELLAKEQPSDAERFDPRACLCLEYHYPTLLPEGLLPRFIVRTYVLSTRQPRWRSGVILQLEGSRALVVGDPIARRVRVAIAGPDAGRRRLLAVIRSDFDRIHASYKFVPQEMVPVPGYPEVVIPYEDLLVYERAGEREIKKVIDSRLMTLDVKHLLDGIDLEGARPERDGRVNLVKMPRAFISYSHKDDMLRAELETHLKLLQRRKLLDTWTDRRITPGNEWKGEIDANLNGAELILLLVSADFIASDYCYDLEMTRALERHAAGSARVIPIIVRDVNWQSAPFAKLQALPKDGKAVAAKGKARLARDAAWKNVAEGIEKVLKELAVR